MLNTLHEIERALPSLLATPDRWRSLDIDYHPPRVERVVTDVGALRVSLHCIHPCARGEALLHPHPWPSAVKVLDGAYEMDVGSSPDGTTPPLACTLRAIAPFEYEMLDPSGWHAVRPIDAPVYSVMVTGAPWGVAPATAVPALHPLPEARRVELLAWFAARYPRIP